MILIMRKTRKVIIPFLVILFGAVVFAACETGGDSNSTLSLAGPRSVQVTAKDGALVLQWTRVAPAQGVVPFCEVYYWSSANAREKWPYPIESSEDSRLVSATITGLANHAVRYVWVKAVYPGLGVSDYSPTAYGTPIPPPGTPGSLRVTVGEEMLDISWPTVEDAFSYELHYKAAGTGSVPPADTEDTMLRVSEPGAVIPGLENGTSYTIRVRAVNTAGSSPPYAGNTGTPREASAPPAAAPDAPVIVPGDTKLILRRDTPPIARPPPVHPGQRTPLILPISGLSLGRQLRSTFLPRTSRLPLFFGLSVILHGDTKTAGASEDAAAGSDKDSGPP